jgi:fatty acid desaturase
MTPVQRLSSAAKAEIKTLSGARPAYFALTVALTWITVGITIGLAIYLDSIFATLFAIYIVATRQNILALLVHEQTHYLGFNTRHGDWIANLLVAYPLLAVSIESYAKIHLRHHRHYFSQEDPDFLRKNGPDWAFPMAPAKLALLFLSDISGLSFIRFVTKRIQAPEDAVFRRRNPSPSWLKPLFFLSLGVTLTLAGGWMYFLLYWALPLVTVFPAIVRWGAICEHVYGTEGVSVEESSPVILPTLAGRIFLPNLNFAMHPYHHFMPGVSFRNLPALHRVFEREGLVFQPMVFTGQGQYLKYLLTGSRTAVPAASRDGSLPAAVPFEEASAA